MSFDEKIMEMIEEDLFNASEFGDPYYYEGLRELERLEAEKQKRFQERISSTSRRNRNREHDETLPLPESTPSSSMKSHKEALEMMRKNHSEMYRNEYLEKMYEDSKKNKKNVEKSIAPVTKDEPVEEKKEDPITMRKEVIEPEILKEMTATKKRERRKKNAMLNALQNKMKTSLSDDSKSLSQYSTDVNEKKESVVNPLPEKSRESPAVTDRLTALLLGKDLEEYRDSKSSESSSADLKSVNRYSIDANEKKKSVVKALPETTQESIDVTDRFAASFRRKDVEEYCDAKSSESSSATYYSAHSDLSEQGDGDISVKDVKHKKKTHTTSQRRQNRTVLSLASATKAPPKPYVYVPSSKGHSSLDLSSKAEFPQL